MRIEDLDEFKQPAWVTPVGWIAVVVGAFAGAGLWGPQGMFWGAIPGAALLALYHPANDERAPLGERGSSLFPPTRRDWVRKPRSDYDWQRGRFRALFFVGALLGIGIVLDWVDIRFLSRGNPVD